MVYQYAFNTNNIVSLDEVNEFYNIVSYERREKINRFYFVKDKVHSLFAEIVLRYALWDQYGFKYMHMKFQQSEYGKPYLPNNKDIFFNLSHSGNWVLCGISNKTLGIDVEQINEKELSIANKIYTKEECNHIFTQSMENRVKEFYKIWTLKESYVKCIGKGLSIPFNSFMFQFYEDDIQFYLQGERNFNFLFKVQQLDQKHFTALCVYTKSEHMINDRIRILTLEELLKWKDLFELIKIN